MVRVRSKFQVAFLPQERWCLRRPAVVWALSALALLVVLSIGEGGAGAASTTVTEKNNPAFGMILADSAGKTLYTLTNNGQPVLCTGVCAGVWPPLTVQPGTQPTGPPGVCCLGTTTNANGDAVTYKGDPLYRYVNDSSPSDATGDGVTSFGGTWHVVRVASSTTTTTTAGASTTTTVPAATTATVPASTATTAVAAPTATSATARSASAVPLGSPGTGGTPPRSSHVLTLVGIGAGAVAAGVGWAAAAVRRSRGAP